MQTDNIALYAFQQYGDAALQAAFCCCGNLQDAQDIAQEVFLALHRDPHSFSSDRHLLAWVLRTVISRCRALQKPRRRHTNTGLDALPQEDGLRALLEQIAKLPPDVSGALYLHEYAGCSLDETAKMLGTDEQAVRTLVRRGRAKLRMEQEDES